jgi:DNA-binding IclR family transcriptional regulator
MNNSVTKAIQLLEELAKAEEPVALGDLARVTHLNKAAPPSQAKSPKR